MPITKRTVKPDWATYSNVMLRFIVLVLCISMGGCASSQMLGSDYALDSDSGNGILVASVSYRGGYSGYAVFYERLEGGARGMIEFGKGMAILPVIPRGDFSHLNRKGKVFAVELPAGSYHVERWRVHSGYAWIIPSEPFSLEFEISPGRVTYLGNFDFIQTASRGLTVTGVEVMHSDHSDVDMQIFLDQHPLIDEQEMIMGVEANKMTHGIGGAGVLQWHAPPLFK